MSTLQRIEPGGYFSHAVTHNGIVHISGVVSPGKTVREQTHNVLSGIDGLLARTGSHKSRILIAEIWLDDIRKLDELYSVWDAWVVPGSAPAQTCVELKFSLVGFSVEIAVTAAL